ncbi:MAG: cyclic nucleotide-binding domain-containing protein [Chloroflexi bacterium]|nr:cyclic nucleotide-binding domain-containing protein [Chloroflexota bacterium]
MVSPELLRRYPFFGFLDDTELKAVAMIAEEISCGEGDTVFAADTPADALYLLEEGCIDLFYVVVDRNGSNHAKEFFISELNIGDMFGMSALIEPYQYTAAARATCPSRVIRIAGAGLRALCEVDTRLAYGLMRQTAKTAIERLHDTRVQLAAARN